MTEPTVSQLPGAYDDASSLLGELIDNRSFTLDTALSAQATDNDVVVVGSLADIDLPIYITFDDAANPEDNEIIFCETIGVGGDTFTSVVRGARGTTIQAHAADAVMYIAYMGLHATMMLRAILAAQRYQGLAGPATGIPGTPVAGEVYIDTDNDKVYMGVENGGSPQFKQYGIVDHGEWNGKGDDDHSQYHNDVRAEAWHDGLAGSHVYDGDSHDHTKGGVGTGAGRIRSGPTTGRPGTATDEREIYYDIDTDELYISNASLNWVKIIGAPIDAIAMYRDLSAHSNQCPQGWTRYTDLDSRMPLGCEAGQVPADYGTAQAEGSDTHEHTYSDIPQHYHSVSTFQGTGANKNEHSHTIQVYGGSGPTGYRRTDGVLPANVNMGDSGTHTHSVDMPADSTDSTKRASDDGASVAQGTTSTEDSRPPFLTVVFCEKD